MEFMQYEILDQGNRIATFWIDETGEVDVDNLPHAKEVALLIKTLRLRNVEIEFTGRVEDD